MADFERLLNEGNEAYIPRSNYDKDEVFRDNEYLRQRLSELWIKVKAGSTANG